MADSGFKYKRLGSVLFLRVGDEQPEDEFWREWIAALEGAARGGPIKVLVDARRGKFRLGPQHRDDLRNAVPVSMVRSALLTDNVFVRGVATALTWTGYAVHTFGGSEIDKALEYLNCSQGEQDFLREAHTSGDPS